MVSNEEITHGLDDLLSARQALDEAKNAIVESAGRKGSLDKTLEGDVERFTAAFDRHQRVLYEILDAVNHRIRGPLP